MDVAVKGLNMNTITVAGVAKVAAPRGAIWAARVVMALWRVLARQPRAGAMADDGAAREVARVRALARHHLATDPGFAADLLAAADRHEAALQR
jgi:hypothetical protein